VLLYAEEEETNFFTHRWLRVHLKNSLKKSEQKHCEVWRGPVSIVDAMLAVVAIISDAPVPGASMSSMSAATIREGGLRSSTVLATNRQMRRSLPCALRHWPRHWSSFILWPVAKWRWATAGLSCPRKVQKSTAGRRYVNAANVLQKLNNDRVHTLLTELCCSGFTGVR